MSPVITQRPPSLRGGSPSCAAATSDAPSKAADLASALATLPGGVVDGSEIVILAIKPSMWRPLFESAPWLLGWGAMAVALTVLERPLPGWSVAATAQIMILIAFVRLAIAVTRWIPSWYVLTNRRIIEIRGVRAPRISSCMLVQVRNTYLNASGPEKAVRLGTITFVTEEPSRAAQVWHSIARPDQVHAEIRRAIENAIDHQGFGA